VTTLLTEEKAEKIIGLITLKETSASDYKKLSTASEYTKRDNEYR